MVFKGVQESSAEAAIVIGPVEFFSPMAEKRPNSNRYQQPRGMSKKFARLRVAAFNLRSHIGEEGPAKACGP